MSNVLWYNQFVDDWNYALPLGNGRVGAMVYGNPNREVIEINEESLWNGGPLVEKHQMTPEILKEVRRLIFDGEIQRAKEICYEKMFARPYRIRSYEAFGELFINFHTSEKYADYRKQLDLEKALCSVFWTADGKKFESESFVSEAYDVLVYRVRCDCIFSCDVGFLRERDARVTAEGDTLYVDGRLTYEEDEKCGAGGVGISFGAQIKVQTDGVITANERVLSVTGATYLLLYGAFRTNYDVETFAFDEKKDYKASLSVDLNGVIEKDYEEVKAQHYLDHAKWFGGTSLRIDCPDYSALPTDVRLQAVKDGRRDDYGLYALHFQYGRYLLIESSGKNATLPANLQGIWCHGLNPPWQSDYHMNINLQMNYWHAESCGLQGAVLPLVHFVKMLSVFGKDTAENVYFSKGWTLNSTTDIFGKTGLHDRISCGIFPIAGAWMCLPLLEHYEYTADEEYLKEIYPVLKGACDFICGYLTPWGDYLVTNPSGSPENYYKLKKSDEENVQLLTYGATIDGQIIYDLFTKMRVVSQKMDDAETNTSVERVLAKLPAHKNWLWKKYCKYP